MIRDGGMAHVRPPLSVFHVAFCANYTLYERAQDDGAAKPNPPASNGITSQLTEKWCKYALVRSLVQLVIKPSGGRVWSRTSCTTQTRQSAESPHFNFAMNIRMNVPPCDREVLRDLFVNLTHTLDALGITYLWIGGTALAQHRQGYPTP